MEEKVEPEKCPTCGRPMKFVKSTQYEDEDGRLFERFQIWHCLNCSEEWELDIMDNIWRKNAIIER